MMKRLIVIFGMVVVLIGFMTPVSQADPLATLRISSGTTSIQIWDNMTGDANTLLGAVTYVGPVGGWNLNVTTGLTYPILGTSALPSLDLNSVNSTPGTTNALTLEFSQYYLNYPTVTPIIPMTFEIGGTGLGLVSLTASAWYEAHPFEPLGSALLFNRVSPIGTTLTFNTFPGWFGGSTSGNLNDGFDSHFTVTEFVQLTPGTGPADASFNARLRPVPEPTTMLLLGLGLIGLAGIRRKFKSSKS